MRITTPPYPPDWKAISDRIRTNAAKVAAGTLAMEFPS